MNKEQIAEIINQEEINFGLAGVNRSRDRDRDRDRTCDNCSTGKYKTDLEEDLIEVIF